MSFELNLTFGGLTALVPRKDAASPGPAEEWLVVMPALAQGAKFEKKKESGRFRRFTIPPHQALLVVNALLVREGTTKKERLRVTHPDGKTDRLFALDHEVLKIKPGTKGLQVVSGAANGESPESHEIHDVKWVPLINVPFKKSLLHPQSLQPADAVTGVVLLDRGTLETVDVYRDLENKPAIYDFLNGRGEVVATQALAKGFRLRVEVDQDEAALLLIDGVGVETLLVVGPAADGHAGFPKNEKGDPIVDVRVFNQELEPILGFGGQPNLKPLTAEEKKTDPGDEDFAIFYRLSSVWESMNVDDVALPRVGGGGGGGGGDRKPCDPPTYTGLGG